MNKKSNKIDFNNPGDIGSIVNQIASSKTGKNIKVPIKFLVVLLIYFIVCGLSLNIYWVYKLICNLF